MAENAGRSPSTCEFKDTPVPAPVPESGSPSRSAQKHPCPATPQGMKGTERGHLCLEQRPPALTQARAGPWALTVPRDHLVGVVRGCWSIQRGPASGLLLLTVAALAKRLTPRKNHWAEFPGTGGYGGGRRVRQKWEKITKMEAI